MPNQLLLCILFRLSNDLVWKSEHDEDQDLKDQALAATGNNNTIGGKRVPIFHTCLSIEGLENQSL